jgi:hypothetical protein
MGTTRAPARAASWAEAAPPPGPTRATGPDGLWGGGGAAPYMPPPPPYALALPPEGGGGGAP